MVKTGTWFVFDDNGTKRFEMNYLEGQKTGIWTNWDEQGLILASKITVSLIKTINLSFIFLKNIGVLLLCVLNYFIYR